MKKPMKRIIVGLLVLAMTFGMLPMNTYKVKAAATTQDDVEEEFLGSTGAVIAQYTQGTQATVFLEATVADTTTTSCGVVINGTKYAKTGNVINGSFIVQLTALKSDTTYTAYPYAGNLVSENGITFTTAATTTTSGNLANYYSLAAGKISYCIKNTTGTVDIQGASQTKTTYSNAGWGLANGNTSVQLYAVPTIVTGVSGNQYVRLTYVARNNTTSTVSSYRFGINCDSMIGTNDSAPVYTTTYGMRVAASTAANALAFAVITKTSNAADGLGRMVDNVTTQWYGNYSSRTSNQYVAGSTTTLTNIDSGMSLSWQNITLAPGEVKTYSIIFGVADSAILSKTYEQLTMPTLVEKTYNSITIDTVEGQTYYIETSAGTLATYEATETGTYTFEGLNGGTNYSIYTDKTEQSDTTYIASNNLVVTTLATPALKSKIENIASFKTIIGNDTDLVSLLSQKVEGLTGTVTITAAELVNEADSQYVELTDGGSRLTGKALTPDGYKVVVKITAMQVDYSNTWGNGVVMNDVILRVRVTQSETPYLTKYGSVVTFYSTDYHGLAKVIYSYTGDSKVNYTSWYNYHTYGKSTDELKAVNGVNGYKSKVGTATKIGVDEEGDALYSSTLHQTTMELPKIGCYTFLLTDHAGNEYVQYVNIDAADFAIGKPRLYQDNNLVTYVNNNSGLYKVNYIYTGDAEYKYTTWSAFVAKGKLDTSMNTTTGYKVLKGTTTGTTASTIDGSNIRITVAGWYTFLMTYKDAKEIAYTVYISPEDAMTNIPYLVQRDDASGIVVYSNNSYLTKVTYQYSDPTNAYTYTAWGPYATNGKRFTEINGSTGYKSTLGTVTDGVSSLDGKAFNLVKAGWYTFLFFYNLDGAEMVKAQPVYIANDFDDVTVSSNNFQIQYHDSLVAGGFSEYAYQYVGAQEPTINTATFAPDKTQKINVTRTEDGGNFDFTVSQEGWYIVRVKDTALGTKYYKVQVTAPEALTDPTTVANFPYLYVDGVNITALSEATDILYIRIGNTGEFTRGSMVSVTDTGLYTVQVIDNDGKLYALTANVSTIANKVFVDTEALATAIADAENWYQNSGYVVVDDIYAQTEPGTYISTQAHTAFNDAIAVANAALTAKTSQTTVTNATKAVKTALSTYKAAIRIIYPQLVTVDGSTIKVAPIQEGDSLVSVYYNTQDGEIMPVCLNTWAQMILYDKTKVTKFNTDGALIIENVPDGIYTFLVAVNENGVKRELFQYAVVKAQSTGVEVAKAQLSDPLYAQLTEWMNTVKKEADAQDGETYVSSAVYTKLVNAYTKATTLLASETCTEADVTDVFIPFMCEMLAVSGSVKNGRAVKVVTPTEPEDPVEIMQAELEVSYTADNSSANLKFTSPDLSSVHVSYGLCTNWNKMVALGYKKLTLASGVANHNVLLNGTYTALLQYKDGSAEYRPFTVTDVVYPFTIVDADGKINVVFNRVSDISYVSYGFGDNFSAYNSAGLLYYDATTWNSMKTDEQLSFTAMGNGTHTLFIKATNGTLYTITTEIQSCVKPAVVRYDGMFCTFDNGFSIKSIAYAQGSYDTWEAMYNDARYISAKSWIDESTLEPGTYTICFSGFDNTRYFETITIE
ncbi:hypothetical protein [Anaerosporobacter sp.]|uniref:hypothetical protein n=1 Tax=Anaerosporobacter sp. TaxID=1872529 RepID=UPI00286F80CD|nr:hypothetical protein [Anaerosporobacter sp.]